MVSSVNGDGTMVAGATPEYNFGSGIVRVWKLGNAGVWQLHGQDLDGEVIAGTGTFLP